jgi:outer membrane protein OmpA-like peptidoglycan-associated protein
MRTTLLASISLIALSITAPAFADSEDAAYDKNNQPVYSSTGSCVRTKWDGDRDPCAAKQEAKPKSMPAPVRAVAPVRKPAATLEQRTIYFDFNSASLSQESKDKLDTLANIINGSGGAVSDVRIHGFTDQMGSAGHNSALANKRAAAVKSYLNSKSRVKVSGTEIKGLGKSVPTEGCGGETSRDAKIACMVKERRVEVELKVE